MISGWSFLRGNGMDTRAGLGLSRDKRNDAELAHVMCY